MRFRLCKRWARLVHFHWGWAKIMNDEAWSSFELDKFFGFKSKIKLKHCFPTPNWYSSVSEPSKLHSHLHFLLSGLNQNAFCRHLHVFPFLALASRAAHALSLFFLASCGWFMIFVNDKWTTEPLFFGFCFFWVSLISMLSLSIVFLDLYYKWDNHLLSCLLWFSWLYHAWLLQRTIDFFYFFLYPYIPFLFPFLFLLLCSSCSWGFTSDSSMNVHSRESKTLQDKLMLCVTERVVLLCFIGFQMLNCFDYCHRLQQIWGIT